MKLDDMTIYVSYVMSHVKPCKICLHALLFHMSCIHVTCHVISHIMCYVSCHVTCYVSCHVSWHKSCNVKYLATHTLLIVLNNYLTNLTILSNVIYPCHKSCTHVTCHVSYVHVTCHVSMSHVMYSISFFNPEYWITLDMRY